MSVSKLEFKDSTYLDTAFPASERIYIQGRMHPSVRVPLREISLKDDSRQRVPVYSMYSAVFWATSLPK